ncbi:hypothetical protein [Legionella sp. PC997]|nr:hypothetical protein [Legionella sp. PC997]
MQTLLGLASNTALTRLGDTNPDKVYVHMLKKIGGGGLETKVV